MTAPSAGDWATVPFRKSSRSSINGGQCVEVGYLRPCGRHSGLEVPGAGLVELPAPAWARFLLDLQA